MLWPLIRTVLGKTVLMKGHNIHFDREIKEIKPKLYQLPLLVWSTLHSIRVEGFGSDSWKIEFCCSECNRV